jgi:hypothetical protein
MMSEVLGEEKRKTDQKYNEKKFQELYHIRHY